MEFVVTRRNQSGSRGAGSSLETEDIGYNGMPFIRWAELAEWSNPGDTEEVEAGLPKPETLKRSSEWREKHHETGKVCGYFDFGKGSLLFIASIFKRIEVKT